MAVNSLSPFKLLMGAAMSLLMTAHAFSQMPITSPRSMLDVARQTSATGDFRDQAGLLDVRILGLEQAPEPWTIAASLNTFYSSNATLNSIVELDDIYAAATVLAAFEPQLFPGVKGLFSIREDVFRYDDLDALDFEFMEASAGLTFTLPEIPSTALSVRYVYSRLTDGSFDEETFDEHSVAVALQSEWRYSQTFRVVFGIETQQSLHAEPSSGRRTDYIGKVTGVFEPIDKLQLTAGYEGGYFEYGFAGREDFNHIIRVGVTYRPVEWAWIGASVSYIRNHADPDPFDYDAWLVGLGAGIEYRF